MIDGGLRSTFSRAMPEAQWTAIETGLTGRGVPDCEFCFPGGASGWIEYKLARGNVVRVRPEQVGWVERRVRLGGRVFVAVRRDDELLLYRGGAIRPLKVGGIPAALPWLLGGWGGGGGSWPWDAIRAILEAPEGREGA
jgi:hypothetical protein